MQSPSMMVPDAAPKMQPLLSPEKYRFYQEFVASGGRLTLF
ncbi:hypothetical protein [Brenneria salicis]|nr:hypothetical protein [Brenneria salicis]